MSDTTRLRYKGPFGEQVLDRNSTGDDVVVIRRGETIDCPFVDYAEQLKQERPEQWDSGEEEATGDQSAPPEEE